MLIDPWVRIHPMFDVVENASAEIEVIDLSRDAMHAVFQYVVEHCRNLNATLYTFASEDPITVGSAVDLVNQLADGNLIGGVGGNLTVDSYQLPMMGFFTDEPGFLMIEYPLGPHWNPMAVIALFEFFRMVRHIDQNAKIQLNKRLFDKSWRALFERTLREYLG